MNLIWCFFRYRVVMMGDAGTGKTALVSQFMTSEYMHTYDASLGKSQGKFLSHSIFLSQFLDKRFFLHNCDVDFIDVYLHTYVCA